MRRRPSRAAAFTGVAGASVLALGAGALPATATSAATLPAGARAAATSLAVVRADAVTTVADGATAALRITLSSAATTGPVTVRWATGKGSATRGRDFRPASGSVTFAAGTPAGATRTVRVASVSTSRGETAETIPVELSARGATLSGSQPTVVIDAHGLPYLNRRLPVADRVRDLLRRMTLADKVGQMTQAERGAVDTDRGLITTWKLGSLLSGGGSTPATNDAAAWADMVDAYQSYALQTPLQIPLIYGVDSVHGHGNLYGATLIPHNIGLGSTRNPRLVRRAEHMVAAETRATGIPWVFAPCVCVARDTRWGRTYESFGEDPSLVIAMETAIDGLQGRRTKALAHRTHVLATAKHFAGDGDTTYGSGLSDTSDYPIDQGITQRSWKHFSRIDLAPYVPAVNKHHVGSVMPSYSSVDFTNDGLGNPIRMHARKALMQGWLKDKVGFKGFIISDYNGIHQIPPTTDDMPTPYQIRTSINAGVDMAMEPWDYQKFETRLMDEVKAGRVTGARINDAVSRILTKKFQLGLFEHPYADRTGASEIGGAAHRMIARKAAAQSQVLLKNAGDVLPLQRDAKVYVAGRNADNLGNQAGGWTITWQGQSGTYTEGTTILQGMREVAPDASFTYSKDASAPMTGSDVGVVVVGETPYSEGFGDVGGPQWAYDPSDNGVPREHKSMWLKKPDREAIDRVCTSLPKCVVLVVSGRPQLVTDRLGEIDALVASWLPGTEGAGVADVLFGARAFRGQLSQSWPRTAGQEPLNVGDSEYRPLFPFGWGMSTRRVAHGSASARVLRRAERIAGGNGAQRADRKLVRLLRLYVQKKVLDPSTGVPAAAADLIARADVATLKGNYDIAVTLLLKAALG